MENKNKREKAKKIKWCEECIFCLSKCPKCKSTDVKVEFTDSSMFFWSFNNDTLNNIYLKRSSERGTKEGVTIMCNKCDVHFDQNNRKVYKLFKLLEEYKFMPLSPNESITCDTFHAFIDGNGLTDNDHFIKMEWSKKLITARRNKNTYVTNNFSYKKDPGKLKFMQKKKSE